MAIVAGDILSWHDMTDGSGTTVTDQSGNTNGTLTGSTGWSSTALLDAKFSNRITFPNIVNSRFELNYKLPEQASFSFLYWIRIPNTSSVYRTLNQSFGDHIPHVSGYHNAGSFTARLRGSDGTFNDILSSSISANTWYHYVVVYDHSAATFKFYLNNTQQGSTATGITLTSDWSGTELLFGAREGTNNQPMNGDIQQSIVINRAIDNTEISSIYNGGEGETYATFFSGGGGVTKPNYLGFSRL